MSAIDSGKFRALCVQVLIFLARFTGVGSTVDTTLTQASAGLCGTNAVQTHVCDEDAVGQWPHDAKGVEELGAKSVGVVASTAPSATSSAAATSTAVAVRRVTPPVAMVVPVVHHGHALSPAARSAATRDWTSHPVTLHVKVLQL